MGQTIQIADIYAKMGIRVDQTQFAKATKALQNIRTMFAGIAASAAVKNLNNIGTRIVRAVSGAMEDVASRSAAAVKSAAELGTTTRSIQELEHAARAVNVPFADLRKGMVKLVQSGSKNVDASLARLADRFSSMPDGPRKTRIALAALGESGPKWIPLLNKGAAGIAELRKQAHEFGAVLDDQAIANADKWSSSLGEARLRVRGLVDQLGAKLMPVLTPLVERMNKWVAANKELLGRSIDRVVTVAAKAVEGLGKALAWTFEFIDEHEAEIKAVFHAIGEGFKFAGKIIWTSWKISIEVWRGIIKVGEKVVEAAKAIGRGFERAAGVVKDAFGGVRDFFVDVGKGIASVATSIYDGFAWVAGGIRTVFESVFGWIGEKIQWAIEKIEWVANKVRSFVDFGSGDNQVAEAVRRVRQQSAGGAAGPSSSGSGRPAAPPTWSPPAVVPTRSPASMPAAATSTNVDSRSVHVGKIEINEAKKGALTGAEVRRQIQDFFDTQISMASEMI